MIMSHTVAKGLGISKSKMYAIKITFMSGPDDGRSVWLKSNENRGHAISNGWAFVMGRGDHCDLIIPYDTQVSREHAHLQILEKELLIMDCGSRNGTLVQQRLISTAQAIDLHELVRVGRTWLKIEEITR